MYVELDSVASPRVTKVLEVVRDFTVSERLTLAKVLLDSLVAELPDGEEYNPWIATAGIFSDDPTWDEFTAAMAQYRREIDEADEN